MGHLEAYGSAVHPFSIEPRFRLSVPGKTEPRNFSGSPRTTRPRPILTTEEVNKCKYNLSKSHMEVPTLTNRSNLETHFKTLALQHMPATQREIPGRPTREGKEAPPLPAPLPAGNSGDNIVTRRPFR